MKMIEDKWGSELQWDVLAWNFAVVINDRKIG